MIALSILSGTLLFLSVAGITFLLSVLAIVWIAEWWHYRQRAKYKVDLARIAREWEERQLEREAGRLV